MAGWVLPAGPAANSVSSRVVMAVRTCPTLPFRPPPLQPGSIPQIQSWVPAENTPAPLGVV